MRREMPYYRLLARGLAMAPHRVNAAGETELSDLDAATLRNCGFPTAAPGRWKIPPLPADLVRAYGLPAHLSDGSEPPAPTLADTAPALDSGTLQDRDAQSSRPISPATASTPSDRTLSVDPGGVVGPASANHPDRRGPVPTRAAYYTPTKRAQRAAANTRRLDAGRAHFGHVLLRLVPQVRMCPERPDQYGALLGHAFTLRVDEPADVVALLNDLERFVRNWRPTRTQFQTPERQ